MIIKNKNVQKNLGKFHVAPFCPQWWHNVRVFRVLLFHADTSSSVLYSGSFMLTLNQDLQAFLFCSNANVLYLITRSF